MEKVQEDVVMQFAHLRWTRSPEDVAAFHDAVTETLGGKARRKNSGCRPGWFVVREEAVEPFRRLAEAHHLEVYFHDVAAVRAE